MKRLILLLFFVALSAIAPGQSRAQASPPQPATILVADDVRITPDNKLLAVGNVEVMYKGRRLQASTITYDKQTDTLHITGPITLHEEGNTLILASTADISRDLQNGILTSARVVMENQLQLAAHEMRRVNGQLSQLYKATVTSCRICETGRPPLWQIRAVRVIHDQQAQQLYFHNAQFRVLDTPVFYLPRLRLPDPTLKRATGFLIPSMHNSTLLGIGAKVPFFIKMGDHRDLTLTPFLSSETRTLEFRYRQAFRNGRINLNGAFSDDDVGTHSYRAYVFANGQFQLPKGFKLNFDVEAVKDDTYLLDYSYSDKDRLDSEISVDRAKRDEYIRGAVTHFHSLRVNESNSTLPTLVSRAEYERRIFPTRLGGELFLSADAHNHLRTSNLTTDGADFDTLADGRDVTRLTGSADWHKNWILPAGILATFQTGLALDTFNIHQAGTTSRSSATKVTPSTAVKLRWPLVKAAQNGVSHVIEPVVQLSWIGGSNPNVPNDESTRVEFDEGNLFNLSRFTSTDRRERGYNAAYGVSWTRFDPDGWQGSLAVGQVIRDEVLREPNGTTSFTNSSGLRDKHSDLLLSGQFKSNSGITVTARSLVDDQFDATKAEARASWKSAKANIGATYIWLSDDRAENRPGKVSEWSFDGSYRLSRHWTGSANWRYDIASDRSVRAGVGMKYTNECVDISLSASRRFTSSTILEPSTAISLTVGVRGFTTKTDDQSYVRTCRK